MCYGPGAMETTIYATYASRKKQFIATMFFLIKERKSVFP